MERTRFVRPTILAQFTDSRDCHRLRVIPEDAHDDLAQWLNTESTVSTSKVLNNILGNGAVIASRANPASGVCHPDYFYHWVRDGSSGDGHRRVDVCPSSRPGHARRGIWDYSRNTSTFRSACKIQII